MSEKRKRAAPQKPTPWWADPEKVEGRTEPLFIGVYNYKGGVGKTTLVINLATELARTNANVLLVDADPQCNLSTFLIDVEEGQQASEQTLFAEVADSLVDSDSDDDVGGDKRPLETGVSSVQDPQLINIARARSTTSQLHRSAALLPQQRPSHSAASTLGGNLGEFNESLHDVMSLLFEDNLEEFVDYSTNGGEEWNTDSQPRARADGDKTQGVRFVVPGSPRIVRWETILQAAYQEQGTRILHYFAGFRYAMTRMARSCKADYVVVDMGPSSGMVNQMFAMSCDIIVPPVFPDRFSRSSIEGLLHYVLLHWYERHARLVALHSRIAAESATDEGRHYATAAAGTSRMYPFRLPMKRCPPLLAPALVSRMQCHRENILHVDFSTSQWIEAMTAEFVAFADPQAKNADRKRLLHERFAALPTEMVVPFTMDEPALFAESQRSRVPMVDCTTGPPATPALRSRLEFFSRRHRHLRRWIRDIRGIVDAESIEDEKALRRHIRAAMEAVRPR
jgi:hypothetical protein